MSTRKPTPEQQAAIDASGEVLVSASAGSGKTFVMIEKMIALILSGQADVSSVLAVTFTNLAAAEMKERLRAALIQRINEEADAAVRARLKAQLSEIPTADICTLHAFCVGVIRRYFYEADTDGNFRIIDETEAEKLRARAVSLAFDRLLEQGSPEFRGLCRAFAGSRGFGRLKDVLLRAYGKVISRADYAAFLQGIPARYNEESFDALAAEAFEPVRVRAEKLRAHCVSLAEQAEPFLRAGLFNEKHTAYLAARRSLAEDLLAAPDVFAAARLADGCKLPGKPPNTRLKNAGVAAALALDEQLASLKAETDALKKMLAEFGGRAEEYAAFSASGEVAAGLAELLLAFDEAYAGLKRRAGGLDFSDLEHKCLALLQIPYVCAEVKGRYTHLFVDEYQDVNPAQEQILARVAGENVFMVGDVKQSIYGFRGCSAAFFAQKFERLRQSGRALVLNGNFRSCSNILAAVNAIFSQVMTDRLGAVDYAATSVMQPGSPAQEGGSVCVAFVPAPDEREKPEREVYSVAAHLGEVADEEYAEGALISDLILQETGRTRRDPAGFDVPNQFRDIVVLTRGKTERAERIVAELIRRGIPVAAAAEINVCDYPEVKTMLAILQYLDNGAQDIPLAAALKSAMGGLTDEELAKIRLFAGQQERFFVACERYQSSVQDATAEKLRAFFARAEEYRLRMQVQSAAEIMAHLLAETGMETALLAGPCGAERVRRLQRLADESGTRSVSALLDDLKSGGYRVGMSESGGENAVRVMTMHASKGLEFPVVIVAGMNARFSDEDRRGILFDDEWGFAAPAYDFTNYTAAETLLRTVVKQRLLRRRAEDEMRLFYVAVTRAKSVLHLIFSEEKTFSAETAAEATCFADFVDLSLLRKNYAPVFGGEVAPPAVRVLTAGETDEESKRAVLARYARPYPYAASLGLPVKTSPSQLMRERAAAGLPEEEDARRAEEGYASDADAETGTAYHAFLQRVRPDAPIEAEIARVRGELDPEQAARLDDERLKAVLHMPVFGMLRGFDLYREQAFLCHIPARALYGVSADDPILVQGVIDLLAVRGEECILFDYKYSAHEQERLLAEYRAQLEIYAAAARRLPGVRKVSAYIVNILRGYSVRVL